MRSKSVHSFQFEKRERDRIRKGTNERNKGCESGSKNISPVNSKGPFLVIGNNMQYAPEISVRLHHN
jgi:hypothetical protein